MNKVEPHTHAHKNKSILALLIGMVLLGVFPLDVILPSFPALSAHFDTPSADIALSISIFAIGVAISQFFLGPLSDRLGRKRLLILGLALSILGAIGCANASSFSAFIIFRALQAIGCGCFVLLNALVQDIFTSHERDRVRILMTSASGFFISTSPLAGALLQATLGWTASFYLFALLAGAILVQSATMLPGDKHHTVSRTGMFKAYGAIVLSSPFMGFSLIAAIAFTCHFSFIALSPIIFLDYFQLSQLEFGLALLSYGAAYVLGGVIANRLQKTTLPQQQLTIGLVLIGSAGLALLILDVLTERGVATVLLPMMICTAGTTIARPVATSRAMELFPDCAGTAASMSNTMVFVIGGVASAAVSFVVASFETALGTGFITLSLVGLLVLQRLYRPVGVALSANQQPPH
ncbi:MAG: MFS transporter [Pseudomonas sp.]|nr:MFS transporter [Pseudomonas sp.]